MRMGFYREDGLHFLSNFYKRPFEYKGFSYQTAENAYQAAKCLDPNEFQRIACAYRPNLAKKLGRLCKMRDNFDRDQTMLEVIRAKFDYPEMRTMLLETGDMPIIEENWWGDTYWGVCRGKGENKLGKILMQVREEIRNEL